MSEDDNLSIFRRKVDYFKRRAGDTAILYMPQTTARSQYPDSFTPSGLYRYGDQVDTVYPNWDESEARPLNRDKPMTYYTVNETFWPEFYKNNLVIFDSKLQQPYTKPKMKTRYTKMPTGYHKPSIGSKTVWLEKEKYMNEY